MLSDPAPRTSRRAPPPITNPKETNYPPHHTDLNSHYHQNLTDINSILSSFLIDLNETIKPLISLLTRLLSEIPFNFPR